MTNQNLTNEKNEIQAVSANEIEMSQRFLTHIIKILQKSFASELSINERQKGLIQHYYIHCDRALKAFEEARVAKNKKNTNPRYNNNTPVTWKNVDTDDLAISMYRYARMGLDMSQSNHLFPIPKKAYKTDKYFIVLMPGYNGKRYVTEKYAMYKPANTVVELIYSTDKFKPIKKGFNNKYESYEFEITNVFNRGEILGGFAYIEYEDPRRNKLIIMTIEEIEKRKPEYASAEFWGGTTKVWEDGKQVEKEIEGWHKEMCIKTIVREVFDPKHIPIDPEKIDENYQFMKMQEARAAEIEAEEEAEIYANTIVIDTVNAEEIESKDVLAIEGDKEIVSEPEEVVAEVVSDKPVKADKQNKKISKTAKADKKQEPDVEF